ncbi:aminotransferase class I/II-fold pyridoxal phosphate-dependent enzyme [Caldicellulosiruptor acetigenus]|uniref:methionine gamma-lyase family protein n=1 Tax=Caldicellulosiruptor acetigenus TaxID=301953 RepID=UPI000492D8BB|nr:aminotransferase class I/II-fold pyridoxal phosphate-dependent enzyme [Caldicellulosiruptor acetigenus]WAM37394.1 methionine gamma-lyase family protein [Caldicellulosiruptor acetigenus]
MILKIDIEGLKKFYNFSHDLINLTEQALKDLKENFEFIEQIKSFNQLKVLNAFHLNKLSYTHLNKTDGYGYSDSGRDVIEKIFAKVFGCEDALVRIQFISGTQAIATMLFALLRPGDILLSICGKPYDTLQKVIGIKEGGHGNLIEYGIKYQEIDLKGNDFDFEKIETILKENSIKVVFIQRSRGYSVRSSISIEKLEKVIKFIKSISPQTFVVVDNCYGEFVEKLEPTEVGADLIAGSLIKNPGGTIASCGGYIAGKKELVEMCADRLNSPGMGKEVGPSLGFNKEILQGLLFSPHIVAESLKVAVFTSYIMEKLGYEVLPRFNEKRTDIIQTIVFKNEYELVRFCQGVQKGCPVDSNVLPEPWDMPGYSHKVIMAAGGFVQGTSLELSCDAPIRKPYAAYLQGSSSFEIGLVGVLHAIENIRRM